MEVYSKVIFLEDLFGMTFLRLKTPILSWVRKNPIYHIVIYCSLRILAAHLLTTFLSFPSNIQSIIIIITPAFKHKKSLLDVF